MLIDQTLLESRASAEKKERKWKIPRLCCCTLTVLDVCACKLFLLTRVVRDSLSSLLMISMTPKLLIVVWFLLADLTHLFFFLRVITVNWCYSYCNNTLRVQSSDSLLLCYQRQLHRWIINSNLHVFSPFHLPVLPALLLTSLLLVMILHASLRKLAPPKQSVGSSSHKRFQPRRIQ